MGKYVNEDSIIEIDKENGIVKVINQIENGSTYINVIYLREKKEQETDENLKEK